MAWKNGGGETVEIAIDPPDADLANFRWRISSAVVAEGGAFSSFPGVDRTLCMLSGDGLALTVDGHERLLDEGSEPYSFAADKPAVARLAGGAINDLNVMTRRDRCRHRVERLDVITPLELAADGDTNLLFCGRGCLVADDDIVLRPGDTLMPAPGRRIRVGPRGEDAVAFWIRICEGPAHDERTNAT